DKSRSVPSKSLPSDTLTGYTCVPIGQPSGAAVRKPAAPKAVPARNVLLEIGIIGPLYVYTQLSPAHDLFFRHCKVSDDGGQRCRCPNCDVGGIPAFRRDAVVKRCHVGVR